jgi:hypothetical protein
MTSRNALHMLQDLCEEQNDACRSGWTPSGSSRRPG